MDENSQRDRLQKLLNSLPIGLTISKLARDLGLSSGAFYQVAKGMYNAMTEDRARDLYGLLAEQIEHWKEILNHTMSHPHQIRIARVGPDGTVQKIKIVDPVQDVVIMTADRREVVDKELERLTIELRRVIDEMRPLVEERAELESLAKSLREVFKNQ